MPAKNVIRAYKEDGIYHIYNRGVEKRNIFLDNQDYSVFLFYLKCYLDDKEKNIDKLKHNERLKVINRKNFNNEIKLLAYCLMPNHFHLLIMQKSKRNITEFMRSLATSYVMYFNNKYSREGALFQGTYKAVLVENDEYLLHLSRYIHLNPIKTAKGQTLDGVKKLVSYEYSSYPDYLGLRKTDWLKTSIILDYFNSSEAPLSQELLLEKTYKTFVEDYIDDTRNYLGGIALD